MTIICLNLIDGTVVIGKEIKSDDDVIILSEVLVMSTTSYSGIGTQVFLTKYNIFGDEEDMVFNPFTVITSYRASKYIKKFYREFIDKSKTKEMGLTPLATDPKTGKMNIGQGKTFLSEYEEIVNSTPPKLDIKDLRKNVRRIIDEDDDHSDEEGDNSEEDDDGKNE
jgi:hypothetical protein